MKRVFFGWQNVNMNTDSAPLVALYIYIYSKTRLQIIRWNKSREASTENEEKQK